MRCLFVSGKHGEGSCEIVKRDSTAVVVAPNHNAAEKREIFTVEVEIMMFLFDNVGCVVRSEPMLDWDFA